MEDDCEISFPGLDQLLLELRELPVKVGMRALKGMAGTGASVIRQRIVQLAPEWEEEVSAGHPPGGTLKKSIYQTRMTQECAPGHEVFKVAVRSGKRFRNAGKTTGKFGPTQGTNKDAFYATWIEFGHFTRAPKVKKKATAAAAALTVAGTARWIPPEPFFRPGVAQSSAGALTAMRDYLNLQLHKFGAENLFLKSA